MPVWIVGEVLYGIGVDDEGDGETIRAPMPGVTLTDCPREDQWRVLEPASGNRAFDLQVRTSQWQFSEYDDNTANIGIGGALNRGRTRTVLELGTIKKKDCGECDLVIAGVRVARRMSRILNESARMRWVLHAHR